MPRYFCSSHHIVEVPLGVTSIGRGPASGMKLANAQVEPSHARVIASPVWVLLHALTGAGVYVNDLRVRGSAYLCHGDRLEIGGAQYVFLDLCGVHPSCVGLPVGANGSEARPFNDVVLFGDAFAKAPCEPVVGAEKVLGAIRDLIGTREARQRARCAVARSRVAGHPIRTPAPGVFRASGRRLR